MDGFTSGAIVAHKYPNTILIGFDYGQELPMQRIPPNEEIIMIDVSLPMKEMLELARHSGFKLTWIDHHISAINDFNSFVGEGESFCKAVLKNGIAACEIGWGYLFPEIELPRSVWLLGKYDTWRNQEKHEWENEVLPFQYGMRQICNSPETFPVSLFEHYGIFQGSPIDEIVHSGKTIIQYQKSSNQLLCKRAAFERDFMGFRAICLNMGGASSQSFDSVYNESNHDIMIPFFFTGNKWVVSLYTTKEGIDCSALAKQRGGGGHTKAAGFETTSFDKIFSL